MAAPLKGGLDYFPFPVNFFDDEVMGGITGRFGIKGELVTVRLLCTIYQKGYFAVWNDLLQAQIADKAKVSQDLAVQVVDRLIAWGFFNEDLYNSAKVLTSAKIQQTYAEATKRRKLQKSRPYWINDDINSNSKGVNVHINRQSKVNESKVNKTNKDSRNSKPAKRVYESDDINLQLAQTLLSKIEERNPEHKKPDLQKWANDIRLMHEQDKRPYDKISKMIDWSQANEFWSGNILSALKLRKQYDTMAAQANNEASGRRRYSRTSHKESSTNWDELKAPENNISSADLQERLARIRGERNVTS